MTPSSTPPQEWTIGKLLDWTARYLTERGAEFPRLDTEVLLAQALGCRRIELYTRYAEPAAEPARARFKDLVRKRSEGCPVAYLVGRKEFFSLELEVGPAVLIPRPDTETLVMECLELAKSLPSPAILDVGTGSGAIVIALAKQHPGSVLAASDLSPDALAVAGRNAAKHGVGERIRLVEGDLFAPLATSERFDFIVSNPPYIAAEDWDKLPVGVRQYEPRLALDGGAGGYRVIERLVARAGAHLHAGGWLLVEIGAPQEETVRRLITARPGYALAQTVKDHAGQPRVLKAQWKR